MAAKIDKKKFADNFRALRIEAGWSQSALSKEVDIERTLLSHYETARTFPSLSNLYAVAVAMEIDIERFFKGVQE